MKRLVNSATYCLKGLSIGENDVTASCVPIKRAEIEEHIPPAKNKVIK